MRIVEPKGNTASRSRSTFANGSYSQAYEQSAMAAACLGKSEPDESEPNPSPKGPAEGPKPITHSMRWVLPCGLTEDELMFGYGGGAS